MRLRLSTVLACAALLSCRSGPTTTEVKMVAEAAPTELLSPDPVPERDPSAQDGGILRVTPLGGGLVPGNFNRVAARDADILDLYHDLVGSAVARRHTGAPDRWAGDLAHSVEVNSDYTVFTVHLHKGVPWHIPNLLPHQQVWIQDREVVSDDFVFAMALIQNPSLPATAPWRSLLADLEGFKILDDHTFEVRWKRSTVASIAITLGLIPIPRWLYTRTEHGAELPKGSEWNSLQTHWSNDRFIGTGPFRFASLVPGRALRLVRNDSYHGPPPALDEIIVDLTDTNTRYAAGLRGKVDVVHVLPSQLPADGRQPPPQPNVRYMALPRLIYWYIGWNQANPLFIDRRVRRALGMALDRRGILKDHFKGRGDLATSPFIQGSPFVDPRIKPLPFDLKRASALLEEAGWTDTDGDGTLDKIIETQRRPFTFQLLTFAQTPEFQQLAERYRRDLATIGVRVVIVEETGKVLFERTRARRFEAHVGGWGQGWEPTPFATWHSSQARAEGSNSQVGFIHAEADTIIEAYQTAFEPTQRHQLMQRLHQILHEEQPYTFFMNPVDTILVHKRVRNLRVQPFRPRFRFRSVWLSR